MRRPEHQCGAPLWLAAKPHDHAQNLGYSEGRNITLDVRYYEPGGNVTGLSAMDAELGGKRIQLLSDLIPKLACVGVLATTATTDPFSRPFVADIQAAGSALNVRVAPVQSAAPASLRRLFPSWLRRGRRPSLCKDFSDPIQNGLRS
jgi:hypothetical protein